MHRSSSKHLSSLSLARATLASALTVLLLGATAPRLAAQSDNFNDGNDTGWTHYSLPNLPPGAPPYFLPEPGYWGAATYSYPADDSGGTAYRISAPGITNDMINALNARAGSFRQDGYYSGRFFVGTDLLQWNATWRQEAGLLFYFQDIGLGTSDGYTATYSSAYKTMYISAIFDEVPDTVGQLADGSIVLDPTHRYRLEASSHDGGTFLFQLFDKAEPGSPWASVIGQASHYSAGLCGLFVFEQTAPPSPMGAEATLDNYYATTPAANTMRATVTDLSPPPAGKATAFYPTVTVGILDRDTLVNTNSIVLCLDGVWIPNASLTIDGQVHKPSNPNAYPEDFSGATVTYPITTLLPWGSKHTNIVAFQDSASAWQTNTWTWTLAYPYLFASNSLPVGALSTRGWDYRMVQAADVGGADNSLATAEQQLAIPPGIPYDVSYSTNGLQLLQWNDDTGVPNGVPGLTGTLHDNIACEMLGYMHLTAGLHRFYAHSDDGFQLRSGSSPGDLAATVVGFRDGGTFNGTFDFVVEADGLYPTRCIWYEHGGQALFELDSVDLGDNSHVLINDPTDPTGVVKVYTSTGAQVLPLSSATVNGPYTVEHTAVVDQNAKTVTVPLSGAAKFFRLSSPSATTLSAQVVGSNLVLSY